MLRMSTGSSSATTMLSSNTTPLSIWKYTGNLNSGDRKALPYSRFGNFRRNFIFANSIIRHISDVKNSRLGQDVSISINERVILPFCEGFIFTILREIKVLAKISKFTVFDLISLP